jgi:hypothetical protein
LTFIRKEKETYTLVKARVCFGTGKYRHGTGVYFFAGRGSGIPGISLVLALRTQEGST